MGYNHTDNILLKKDKWTRITEASGLLHFKYDKNTVIYIYEGSADPNGDIPSPDMSQPIMIMVDGSRTQSNVKGKTWSYKNRLGAIWAYCEGKDAYVLKLNSSCGQCN